MDRIVLSSGVATPAGADEVFFQLLAVALLVALNAFFVAFEFAVVKVRATQLDGDDLPGRHRARAAREILRHMEAYLSAAQLGITLTSLGLGWAGEPFVARLLTPVFQSIGISRPEILTAVSFTVAFAAITFLHIVVGEQAPKILAIRRARQILLFSAWPMRFFYAIFRPFIRVIDTSSAWLLRVVFRVQSAGGHDAAHTTEELRSILETGVAGEDAPVSELGREILINALDMRKRVVRDIMTPRGEVVFMDLDESFDANLATAMTSRHTRFPLCRGHLDKAVGLIHIKDLLAMVREGRTDLHSIKRDLVHVPELMPLERLLKVFLSKGAHLAVVVDEYGGAVGMVTLDNVLAELVGEIQDEFDTDEAEYRKIGEGEFLLDGGLALHELADLLGVHAESAEVSTIGGYMTHELGHLPAKGESIVLDGYEFTVRQADDRRVLSVHAKLLPASAFAAESGEEL